MTKTGKILSALALCCGCFGIWENADAAPISIPTRAIGSAPCAGGAPCLPKPPRPMMEHRMRPMSHHEFGPMRHHMFGSPCRTMPCPSAVSGMIRGR
ncbi:MAG: hypothetical protein PHW76_09700 [Alphaproteobacteria bacterium]|nr:hypothetical protein [Alphaproteobacteria bacterium]